MYSYVHDCMPPKPLGQAQKYVFLLKIFINIHVDLCPYKGGVSGFVRYNKASQLALTRAALTRAATLYLFLKDVFWVVKLMSSQTKVFHSVPPLSRT